MANAFTSMKMETASFAKFVRKFAEKSGEAHGVVLRRIAFALLRDIILLSPVLTGRFRAGWGVAAEMLGLRMPPPEDSVEAAKGFIPGEATIGQTRFMATNNIVYGPRLEEGWSQQAPVGMVRLAMRRLRAALGGGNLPAEIKSVYRGVWETGKIPRRAMQPGTGKGL